MLSRKSDNFVGLMVGGGVGAMVMLSQSQNKSCRPIQGVQHLSMLNSLSRIDTIHRWPVWNQNKAMVGGGAQLLLG